MSLFVHIWAWYKNYFISWTNLPREKEAEEIFNEMMNEPEPSKQSDKISENKIEEEEQKVIMSESEEKEVKGSIDLLQNLKDEKQKKKKEIKKIKRPIIIWWKPGEIPMGWACAINLNPSGDLLTTN